MDKKPEYVGCLKIIDYHWRARVLSPAFLRIWTRFDNSFRRAEDNEGPADVFLALASYVCDKVI
jgi:hypothetical protein